MIFALGRILHAGSRQADSIPAEPQGKPRGLHSPWNSPDQNTGVGSLSLLQGVFPIQELNWGLLHCRQIIYQLSYQGSPQFSQPITPKKLAEKSIQYLLLLSLSHI